MKTYDDILGKYKNKGCLNFEKTSNLRQLCKNIPENICGVYMFVLEKNGQDDILYIGSSGHIVNGMPVSRKKGGLRRRVYGKQGKISRDKFYKIVMEQKEVEHLKVYWFDTERDDPEYIEYLSILRYIVTNKSLPEFNNKLERKENKAE